MPTRKIRPRSGKSTKIAEALGRIKGLESEMTHIIREMREKVRQLECLNEFSGLMNSSLDTELVRQKALEATCKLVGCEAASLALIDRKTGELYWEAALGELDAASVKGLRFPIDDQSIAGYVAMSGESIIVNDFGKDPRKKDPVIQKVGIPVRTLVAIPIQARESTIGVLQAINKLPTAPLRTSLHRWPDFFEDDRKLLQTLGYSVSIALENARLYTDIKKNFFETVEALAEAIEKKDRYTGGHTKRVVYYAFCIAKYMNLSAERIEQVKLAAILHDVGKIGIEDKILKKDSSLNPDEWKVMQTHPNLGFEILARVEGLKDVVGGTRYHHERWDGKGYPFGMKGEEIPLVARIISVADTYDAMVSTRPYRKGMDPKIAHDEIVRHSGTQFDPGVVEAFQVAFQKEKMGKGSGGSSLLSNCD